METTKNWTIVNKVDSEYEFGHFDKVVIDGEYFSYTLNSIRRWIIIKSHKSFKGKKIIFVSGKISEEKKSETAA